MLLAKRRGNAVRITHEQLASEINSTREAVSRILKDMERQSLIRLGRGQITLMDPDGLELLAAACDFAVGETEQKKHYYM